LSNFPVLIYNHDPLIILQLMGPFHEGVFTELWGAVGPSPADFNSVLTVTSSNLRRVWGFDTVANRRLGGVFPYSVELFDDFNYIVTARPNIAIPFW